jgi:hypothetical protein
MSAPRIGTRITLSGPRGIGCDAPSGVVGYKIPLLNVLPLSTAIVSLAVCASAALCLPACHDRKGSSPRSHSPDAGPKETLEPIVGTLVGAGWKLTLTFDVRAPALKLSIHDHLYAVDEVSLVLLRETVDGSVARQGAGHGRAQQSYRLRFAIDECENEPPTPSGRWPGICGYPDGGVRPRNSTRYELLVDVDSQYYSPTPTQDIQGVHQIEAACVPASGAGPTCKLEGAVVTRRTSGRNGR